MILRSLVLLILLFSAAAGFANTPKQDKSAGKCIVSLTITRNDSLWSAQADPVETIRAAKLDKSWKPLPKLQEYAGEEGPLIAINDQGKAVVSDRYFTDLRVVKATYIAPGTQPSIGNFKDLTFAVLSPRRLALFLLESQIIQTYLHIESNLCLVSELEDQNSYVATFHGSHVYYTNERNEKALSFQVRVDKKTGLMQISGEQNLLH